MSASLPATPGRRYREEGRFSVYSSIVMDHFAHPRRAGALRDADAVGSAGVPGQGNYVTLYLRVEDGRVVAAGFETYGCPGTIAAGSLIADWVIGKSPAQAAALDVDELTGLLGGMPLGREHCPRLAVEALRDALWKLPSGVRAQAQASGSTGQQVRRCHGRGRHRPV